MAARRPLVLLADDEASITRTLQMVLEQQGYRVLPAFSAAEAISIMSNGKKLDMVITDLNMERDDIGLEVARTARGLTPRPVIAICTGFANVDNTREALKLHVDYLATKPVDLEEFISNLQRLILRRKYVLQDGGAW
jgi:CheY-like chemotaxis protein